MHTRRFLLVAALTVGLTAPAAGALAKAPVDARGVERGPGYVIIDTGIAAHQEYPDGSVFYPTGKMSADTHVIVTEPDGSLPGGVSRAAVRAAARTSSGALSSVLQQASAAGEARTQASWLNWGAFPYTWSPEYSDGIGHMGSPGLKMSYAFAVQPGTQQFAEGKGRGWYVGYNGGSFGTWAKWYPLGSATASRQGGGQVPWGNVTATKRFMAKSLNVFYASGRWQ